MAAAASLGPVRVEVVDSLDLSRWIRMRAGWKAPARGMNPATIVSRLARQ
jgi:hypothetical protein